MEKKALIVVDVQNDFCQGGALAVPKSDEVIVPLNNIIAHASANNWLVVASRDWHPPHTKHFEKWPPHCIQHSWGAEFHPDLGLCHYVFSKGTNADEDGYSAFDGAFTIFDGYGNPFVTPILLFEFMQPNEWEVYIGGLATDYCVKMTAIDAMRHGFMTTVLIDACRAVKDERSAIIEMKNTGVTISTTTAVIGKK